MAKEGVTDGVVTNTDAEVRKKWDKIEIRCSAGPQSAQKGEENDISFILVLAYK